MAEANSMLDSMGWPEAIALLSLLVGLAVPIWIALKAKPLGPFPYRWGVYFGIELGVAGVALLVFGYPALGKSIAGSILLLIGIAGVTGAAGTLWRKRWGALLSMAAVALLMLVPFLNAFNYTPAPQQNWPLHVVVDLAILAVNIFYFKKRWNALG